MSAGRDKLWLWCLSGSACSTNELLTDVSIEFTHVVQSSQETVYQELLLANAAFSQIGRFSGKLEDAGGTPSSGSSALPLERCTFIFQKSR